MSSLEKEKNAALYYFWLINKTGMKCLKKQKQKELIWWSTRSNRNEYISLK